MIADTYLVDASHTVTVELGVADAMVKLDFYIVMNNNVQEISVRPEDFGGFYYVEAQTLYRDEATGKDMAAEIIIPKVKIQSNINITMAPTGDPSTFAFNMDAMPAFTAFNKKKKVMFLMQIIVSDSNDSDEGHKHAIWSKVASTAFSVGTDAAVSTTKYFLDTDDDKFYIDKIEDTTGDVTVANGAPTTAPSTTENYYVDKTSGAQEMYIKVEV